MMVLLENSMVLMEHLKSEGVVGKSKNIEWPHLKHEMCFCSVFPGSIPNQNDGTFQYSQVQYQIKMTGFAVFPGSIPNQNDFFSVLPGSIPNQNDRIFSIPRSKPNNPDGMSV